MPHVPKLPPHPDHGKAYVKTQCPYCDYVPGSRSKYKNHVAYVHEHVRPVQCPDCELRFANANAFARHHEGVHQGLKPFACDFPGCGLRSSQKSYITHHKKTVHEKKFGMHCHSCGKGYNHKHSLRSHMQKHAKEGHDIDSCHVCKKELDWTPGRGKRAKMDNAPESLVVKLPLKRERKVDPKVPLYLTTNPVIFSEGPDLPGTPDQIREKITSLIPNHKQRQNRDWDHAMNQFFNWRSGDTISATKSNTELKADAAEDMDTSYEDDGCDECENHEIDDRTDESPKYKRPIPRCRLFWCKVMNCSFTTSDEDERNEHLLIHSLKQQQDREKRNHSLTEGSEEIEGMDSLQIQDDERDVSDHGTDELSDIQSDEEWDDDGDDEAGDIADNLINGQEEEDDGFGLEFLSGIPGLT